MTREQRISEVILKLIESTLDKKHYNIKETPNHKKGDVVTLTDGRAAKILIMVNKKNRIFAWTETVSNNNTHVEHIGLEL